MEENKKYITIEKQMFAVGTPFEILDTDIKDVWKTNYAYYLEQRKKGGSLSPLIGRMKDKQFQVFNRETKTWEDKNLWDDFSIIDEKTGKKQLLFQNKKSMLIKFKSPVTAEYWSSEQKKVVTDEIEEAYFNFSKSLCEKILSKKEEMKEMGLDGYLELTYDKAKSPAEMYSVHMKKRD